MLDTADGKTARTPSKAAHFNFHGVHHLALVTDDIKKTIDFYAGVLGMPLIHAMKVAPGTNRGNPPFESIRHYFFDLGNDSTLGFFEVPKGAKTHVDRDGLGAMQHCSFAIKPSQVDELCRRLDEANIKRIGPLQIGGPLWSVYFYDTYNDIRLEASYQPHQGEDQKVCDAFRQDRAAMLEELKTITDDPEWLAFASTGGLG